MSAADLFHIPARAPAALEPSRDLLRESEHLELIFRENSGRWVLLPVEFPTLYAFYKKIEANFWTPVEPNWAGDQERIKTDGKLGPLSANTLARLGAHIAICSGIPSDKWSLPFRQNFSVDPVSFFDILDFTCELTEHIQSPEARAFLGFQNMFENFQKEAATLILKHCWTAEWKFNDYNKESKMPELMAKRKWFLDHTEGFIDEIKLKKLAGDPEAFRIHQGQHCLNAAPLAEILVAFAVFKGVHFSVIKVANYTLEKESTAVGTVTGHMARDLALQAEFLFHLYSSLDLKLDYECFCTILIEGLELEYNFLMEFYKEIRDAEFSRQIGLYLRTLGLHYLKIAYPNKEKVALPESKLPGNDGKGLIPLDEPMVIDMSQGFYTPDDGVSSGKPMRDTTSAGQSEAVRLFEDEDF